MKQTSSSSGNIRGALGSGVASGRFLGGWRVTAVGGQRVEKQGRERVMRRGRVKEEVLRVWEMRTGTKAEAGFR